MHPAVTATGATPPGNARLRTARVAARVLRALMGPAPGLAVVLGTGLGTFMEGLSVDCECPFSDIPGWRNTSIFGHKGTIVLCRRGDKPLVVLSGRVHLYEGHSPRDVALPLWSLREWGVKHVVVTCAAGGVSDVCRVGATVEIGTILDFQRFAFGRLSPGRLRVSDAGAVYAAMPGPHYETAADVAVLRCLGVDMVGMSCAAEVAAAQQVGLGCRAIAVVTNTLAQAETPADNHVPKDDLHAEVVRIASQAAGALADVIFSP